MKFCAKCGNQMAEDSAFCSKCGAQDGIQQEQKEKTELQSKQPLNPNLRTSMKIWMIISFVFAGVFVIGCIADASMVAGVCLFGILGFMFLVLAKTPKESTKVFEDKACFVKTKGLSKVIFVVISVFLALFLFIAIINAFDTENVTGEQGEEYVATETGEAKQEKQKDTTPNIPQEFAEECPVSISASMYDNIINYPELSCYIENKTDKEIAAIQLYFVPKDVYGEEVQGIFAQNRLQTDTPISAKGTNSVAWQMIEQSVKSGDLYVYSVYFSDGSEWGDRNTSTSYIKKYALHMQVSY